MEENEIQDSEKNTAPKTSPKKILIIVLVLITLSSIVFALDYYVTHGVDLTATYGNTYLYGVVGTMKIKSA